MQKFKIILSDLHLGAGYAQEGNRLEDFDQDGAFAELLSHVVAESERLDQAVELIFAGDTFDFLQVPALDLREGFEPARQYSSARYALADETSSRRKMDLILRGHPLFFRALRDFLGSPLCSVSFIKGNHDVNLHWAQVKALISAAVGADRAPGRLTFEERCLSREGLYVEHGNQYLEWLNRWPDFEQPHDPDNPRELYLPVGSRFVYGFVNRLEYRHFWLDGVKPITALIWYLFALDFGCATEALRALLALTPSLIWGRTQVAYALSEALRSQDQVYHLLEDERRMELLETNLKERSTFYNQIEMALDLYGVQRSGGPLGRLGAYGHMVLPRGQDEQRAQRGHLVRVAEIKQMQEDARVIVFGHVHEPCAHDLPGGAQYFNAGSWMWSRDMTEADHVAWQDLFRNPARYQDDRRLTYVRVDYDEAGVPHGALHTLTLDAAPERTLWQRFRAWVAPRKE